MDGKKQSQQFTFSTFDEKEKIFFLKSIDKQEEILAVNCNVKLSGLVNDKLRKVNLTFDINEYVVHRFANPYLNAQNDIFKLKYKDKNIGYIFPASALIDDNDDEVFDEIKQAYKFYCIKKILENVTLDNSINIDEPKNLSTLLDENSIFVIVYNPQFVSGKFNIYEFLPSLALRGYYFYPEDSVPNVLKISVDDISELIETRFHEYRNEDNFKLVSSRNILDSSTIFKLLYKKLLVESGDILHRFLILYQVIEFMIDKHRKEDLKVLFSEISSLSNFKFMQKVNDVNNTRKIINKLFNGVNFDVKEEITNAIISFIREIDSDYQNSDTGSAIYDIRNFIFHDYKKIIEVNKHGEILGLTIQYELMIHHLLIKKGKEDFKLLANKLEGINKIKRTFSPRVKKILKRRN